MDTANQQRILGYFIEEAKEHLQTLEQGILQLSAVASDAERVNEMFRAAHSVKGGAAMLGYNSIQKTAHRLEDSFKILQENPVAVDQQLESLFLASYDVLQDLIERLESPAGLPKAEADAIVQQAETKFVQLQSYLQQLLNGGKQSAGAAIGEPAKVILKQMLQLFKQPANDQNRQQLVILTKKLAQLAPDQPKWQNLVQTASRAISNGKYAYNIMAPVIIKDLKTGCDLLQEGKGDRINPSQNLLQMGGVAATGNTNQVTIPVEAKAAAAAILKNFDRQQVVQLIKYLKANV